MNIMGAYTTKNVVCSGFASLTRAIVDRLGYDNLKCDLLAVGISRKNVHRIYSGHAFNLIHIKDEKYGVDGSYTNDVCTDGNKLFFGRTMSEFLRPVSDMRDTRYREYHPADINTIKKAEALEDLYCFWNFTSGRLQVELDQFIKKYGRGNPIGFDEVMKAIHVVLCSKEGEKEAQIHERKILKKSICFNFCLHNGKSAGPFSKKARKLAKLKDSQSVSKGENPQNDKETQTIQKD